jgi:hypothetical protein
MAKLRKSFYFSVPFRFSTYRLPSSLLAYTNPSSSITGALMHHSNPFGCVLGVHVIEPSGLRWQLPVVVFLNTSA